MIEDYNLCSQFLNFARKNPEKLAFVEPIEYNEKEILKEDILSYGEFHQLVANYRQGLIDAGYRKGDKIIILCPINIHFYAFMLSMLSLGMVGVFLDPGIGLKKILTAISDSKSQGIVSIQKVLKFWPLIPHLWFMKKYSVDKSPIGVQSFKNLFKPHSNLDFPVEKLDQNDHVLITFTSGSTGRSKGADRNAKNVYEQLQVIRSNWACDEDQVDFPIFLMFGFMNLLCGITTIIPAADFKSIGDVSPEVIVAQMNKWKITRMSGSYTFNNKVSCYLEEKSLTIPSIKNIVLGGTPVTKEFCQRLERVYPEARSLMTYGSTEVAPISFCPLSDLVATQAKGSFVGKPFKELEVAIAEVPDSYQGDIDHLKVSQGDWGEVLIAGPHVVTKYYQNPGADHANKVKDSKGRVWHRSGDTGYFDEHKNLILTGRLSDLIKTTDKTFHPYLIESQIDQVPGVNRSALIEKKSNIILCFDGDQRTNTQEIAAILDKNDLKDTTIKYLEKIPLDDRHNSKINRIKLKGLV